MGKTHHATVEEATESDNETYAYITCDPDERIEDPKYSKNWEWVDCKRCLSYASERKVPRQIPPGVLGFM